MQRLLTSWEEADFLLRHPIEAARVAETKTFMWTVGYDQILTPPEWYQFDINIGLIPPAGDEVIDSTYGRVLIFPAANGTIYFNADVPATVDTTIQQPQVPGQPGAPTGSPTSEDCDWLCKAQHMLNSVWGLIIVGGAIWLFGGRKS